MKWLKNIFNQTLVALIAAALMISFALFVYWLLNGGAGLIENSQNPFTNPFLWGAIIIAGLVSGASRLWRKYAERQFIKKLENNRKLNHRNQSKD